MNYARATPQAEKIVTALRLHARWSSQMHFSSIVIRATLAVFIALGLPVAAWARERGPRVEVICPMPPAPVRIDAQQVLMYELYVTNFDVVSLILSHVEVFGREQGGTPLISRSNKSVAAAMIRVGLKSRSEVPKDTENTDMRTIAPGVRTVLYVWIELPSNQILPTTRRHRMVFSAASEGLNSDERLEGYAVPVSRDPVSTLSSPVNGEEWVAGIAQPTTPIIVAALRRLTGISIRQNVLPLIGSKLGRTVILIMTPQLAMRTGGAFGEPVLAVADGEIAEVVDGIADNVPRNLPPVTLDNIAGNHVTLQISPNRFGTYQHLQNGSLKVKLHDKVRRGTVIALLGNSRKATAVHLHLQVTDRNSVLESQGMPFVFSSITYLGPAADYEIDKHVTVPWKNSIPPGDTVIEFEVTKN